MAKQTALKISLKAVIITAAAVLAAAALSYHFIIKKPKDRALLPLRTGMTAENIILGYTGGRTYSLLDFTNSRDIVMVFLGESRGSKLLESALGLRKLPGKDTMLIVIQSDGKDVRTAVRYGFSALTYRFPYANLPASYKYLKEPGVIILDRTGVIRLIYSGYSPTIFADISSSLGR